MIVVAIKAMPKSLGIQNFAVAMMAMPKSLGIQILLQEGLHFRTAGHKIRTIWSGGGGLATVLSLTWESP